MKRHPELLGLLAFLALFSSPALANWTLNIGYQNPATSQFGLNFLYVGSKLGFEIGIGYAQFEIDDEDDNNANGNSDDDDDNVTAGIGGDIDLKYFFSGSSVKPYLQGGFAMGQSLTAGDDTGVNIGLGGPFVGLGLFLGSPGFYGYVAANYGGGDLYAQAGIGFDI
jgi:hypothetical protein